jgi:hypothetical protein
VPRGRREWCLNKGTSAILPTAADLGPPPTQPARFEARCPGGRDRCAARRRWIFRIVRRCSASSLRTSIRLRRYDTSRFNQAVKVSVVPLPVCNRFGARRRSDVTTFNLAPVVSCFIDCTTPRLSIAQRAFDRELSPIFIDEDQKMHGLAHRPHSSSASRFTAGAGSGFRPDRILAKLTPTPAQ